MKRSEKIFNYIKSNQEHSTIVGKLITIDHAVAGTDDDEKIMDFSRWMDEFVKKSENFAKSASNA
jgi:hypothetical protein